MNLAGGLTLGVATAYLNLDTSGFIDGMTYAESAMSSFESKSSSMGDNLIGVGSTIQSIGSTLTKTVTVPTIAAGTAVVKTGSDFEYAMSQVKKVVKSSSDFSEEKFADLTAAARKMGRDTTFTATEAANALEYMGMAGWSIEDMLNGLGPVLNLAIAGNLDLARTSDIVTDALTAFGLSAEDTGHFTDILSMASMRSNTNVNMLGESFKYVAPVAGGFKFTAEDTALALGLMANAGIKSSQAGTSLRSVMTNLAKGTGEAGMAIEELGIDIRDAEGNTRSWRSIMDELREKLGGASESSVQLEADIAELDAQFMAGEITQEEYEAGVESLTQAALNGGDAEKVRLAAMLAGKTGMSGLLAIINASQEDYDELAYAIDHCTNSTTGYSATQEAAAIAQDNFQSEVKILISKLSDLAISIFELVKGPLEKLIEKAGKVVDWLNDLDDSTKENIIQFILAAAALGPVLEGFGKIVKTVGTVIKVFGFLKSGIGLVARVLGFGGAAGAAEGAAGIGLAGAIKAAGAAIVEFVGGALAALAASPAAIVVAIVAAVAAIVTILVVLYNKCEGFRDGVNKIGAAIVDFFKNIPENLAKIGDWIGEKLSKLIETLGEWKNKLFEKAIEIGSKFLDGIMDTISGIVDVFTKIFNTILTIVGNFIKDIIKVADGVTEFVLKIAGIIAELPGKIAGFLGDIISKVVSWGADLISKGVDAVAKFVTKVVEKLAELLRGFVQVFNDVVTGIVNWGANILSKGVEVARNFLQGIVDIIRNLPGGVGEHLADTLSRVIDWGANFLQNGITAVSEFLKNIVGGLSGIGNSIADCLQGGVTAVVNWGSSIVKSAVNAAVSLVNGFINGISKIATGISQLGTKIVSSLTTIAKSLFKKGQEMVENIINGIKSMASKAANAFKSILNGGDNNEQTTVNNPRAVGIDYVPYNGYGAQLHEGEMVLTKEEAERYRKGISGNGNSGDTFVFNSPKAIDEREAARLFKQTQRQLKLGF